MSFCARDPGSAPNLVDVLDSVKERRKRLDDADTRISQLLQTIEGELQKHCNVRVSVNVTEPEGVPIDEVLVFGKHDGKWQLIVEAEFADGSGQVTPLLSCTREMRVRAITQGHIEALVRNAASQLDKLLAEREKGGQPRRRVGALAQGDPVLMQTHNIIE